MMLDKIESAILLVVALATAMMSGGAVYKTLSGIMNVLHIHL